MGSGGTLAFRFSEKINLRPHSENFGVFCGELFHFEMIFVAHDVMLEVLDVSQRQCRCREIFFMKFGS